MPEQVRLEIAQVTDLGSLVQSLRRELDHGEAQAIALAVDTGADYLLLDEKEGRINEM